MDSSPGTSPRPLSRSQTEQTDAFRQLIDADGRCFHAGTSRQHAHELRRAKSFKVAGEESKSPFAGSFTELQALHRRNSNASQLELAPSRDARNAVEGEHGMSSAPVEMLLVQRMKPTREAQGRRRRWWQRAGEAVCPPQARAAAPPDVMLFLVLIGMFSGMLGIAMDITIEELHKARRALLRWTVKLTDGWAQQALADGTLANASLGVAAATTAVDGAGGGGASAAKDVCDSLLGCAPLCTTPLCVGVRATSWIGFLLVLCWLSIFLTGSIAPQAAGSGIPEMKSILSGGMKSQEKGYLSLRTLVAKVSEPCGSSAPRLSPPATPTCPALCNAHLPSPLQRQPAQPPTAPSPRARGLPPAHSPASPPHTAPLAP